MGIICGNKNDVFIPKSILNISKSICRIDTSAKSSTGFLIKFLRKNIDFFCLMMNEGVINKQMVEQNQNIVFYYDNENKRKEITLNINERYIKNLRELDIDGTIIEILPTDKISSNYFLLPDKENYNLSDLIYEEITIIQYLSGRLSYSKCLIDKIHNNEFSYFASLTHSYAGIPIILSQNKKVIGINKSSKSDHNADFIWPLLNHFKEFSEIIINIDEGNYYIGEFENDLPNGKGILYNNGNIKYTGDFMDDKFMGNGKYYYDNGNCYLGNFMNSMKVGKGKIFNKQGNLLYEGDFVSGKPEGKGKYIFENGDYYIGDFKNGTSYVKGILYYSNGNIKYEGEFIGDQFGGNGKYIWENGNYYLGKFKDNLRNGKGVLYNKDGTIRYEGNFINGNFTGNIILKMEIIILVNGRMI